MRLLS